MPRLTTGRLPAYRLHKPSGRAVVTLDGRDFYLGLFGSPSSKLEYDRLIVEWLAHWRQLPNSSVAPADLSVIELVARYLPFADNYYRQAGEPAETHDGMRTSPLAGVVRTMPIPMTG